MLETDDPYGSSGGALLKVVVYDPVLGHLNPATVNGTIDMSGFRGCLGCGEAGEDGGVGAGGTILLEASSIAGTGWLIATGGSDNYTAAGGGGGIISLIENLTYFSGHRIVTPGTSSGNGPAGCVFPAPQPGRSTITHAPATGY